MRNFNASTLSGRDSYTLLTTTKQYISKYRLKFTDRRMITKLLIYTNSKSCLLTLGTSTHLRS